MSDRYLIWSNEHRAWWAAGSHGYRPRVEQAGRFSREAALDIVRRAEIGRPHMPRMGYSQRVDDYQLHVPPEIMVREEDAVESLTV